LAGSKNDLLKICIHHVMAGTKSSNKTIEKEEKLRVTLNQFLKTNYGNVNSEDTLHYTNNIAKPSNEISDLLSGQASKP